MRFHVFQAHRKHPEFATVYENTLRRVTAEFSAIQIHLHQDALLSVATLLQAFQTAIEKSQPPEDENERKKIRRASSSTSLASVSSAMSKLEPKRRRGQ
jgi:hypothetical protein